MAANKRQPKLAQETVSYEGTPVELLKFYREMLLIRKFEERVGQMYGMGLIGGFLHLYVGQEAVVVGVENAITRNDPMITSYRYSIFTNIANLSTTMFTIHISNVFTTIMISFFFDYITAVVFKRTHFFSYINLSFSNFTRFNSLFK